jgi:hypothetical protein
VQAFVSDILFRAVKLASGAMPRATMAEDDPFAHQICDVCQFIGVGVQHCIDVPIDTAPDRSAADGPRCIEHNKRDRPDRQAYAELDELRQVCLLAHERGTEAWRRGWGARRPFSQNIANGF